MGEYYERFEAPSFLRNIEITDLIKKNPKGFERDANETKADIEDHFLALHGIDTSSVQIACDNNIVTLTGAVESPRVADFLTHVAEGVLGVRDVASKLEIRSVGGQAT